MSVRVRFAPSPTGKVHIGNLRAAIFNWLFARHEGGRFLLRIEDTDRERSTQEAIEVLLDALGWVGLDWDEEPVYQTRELAAHQAAARRLLAEGKGYLAPPRVSRWATLGPGELAGVGTAARAVVERLRFHEEELREAHRRAFAVENARRPPKRQRDYLEPLLFRPPEGPEGLPALHFRLPGPEEASPFIQETGEEATLAALAEWPVLVHREGLEFIPAGRVREGVPLEEAVFELESRSLSGFAGLEVLDASGRILFRLDEAAAELAAGAARLVPGGAVLRFRRRQVVYRDLVKGVLAKPLEGLKNRVVLRSDGTPVFHLANVVDDHDMGITHIVRGDDHVENTYWHVLLFAALGWEPPAYGHLPMIVNDQGRPLSKRDGDVYVGEYRTRGILPEALFNYLALLGWSPGGDREKLGREEMVRSFSLERVIDTPARFDMGKMLWLNAQYLRERPAAELAGLAEPFLAGFDLRGRGRPWLVRLLEVERERLQTLAELPGSAAWLFAGEVAPRREEKGVAKVLRQPGLAALVGELADLLAALEPFQAAAIEEAVRRYAEERNLSMGQASQPLRVAVTGGTVSPPIGDTLELLGRAEACRRLAAFRAGLGA